MPSALKLLPDDLKITINLADLNISESTTQPKNLLGQPRAQSALEFGIAMPNFGYNIYVMGEPGLGRLSMVTNHLNDISQHLPTPPSYAYVDNFANQREPIAIQLPPGQGLLFCKDIEDLLDSLLITFPAVFESPSYQQKKSAIERTFNQAYNGAIDLVEKRARTFSITLFRENEGITFEPAKNNKVLDDDQFAALSETERDKYQQNIADLEEYLSETLLDLPLWRRTTLEKTKELDLETIQQAITPLFTQLETKYQGIIDAYQYLLDIKANLNNFILDYLIPSRALEGGISTIKRAILIDLYVPNTLIDHLETSGAPVIYEANPTYQNLFGRIEYINDQGALVTNYRKICSGSLHKANGGFLILDAEKLLTYPFVWESLKRALQTKRIEIDVPYADLVTNTLSLKPQVIPLDIKIILVGSRDIYYLLEELDSEFNEIFKVLADFDNYIPLNLDSVRTMAGLMLRYAATNNTKPLTHAAIEHIIEHSCRQAEHQQQLSAHINDSFDIIAEAQLFAKQAKSETIDKIHIELALSAREFRNGRLSQTLLEEMLDDTILINTEGDAIGKINGLTVLEVGGSSFGAPARITATVYPGSRGIVDIEGEVELGQAIHSKGVMILTGYLGHCYAQEFPLAISASIAIEQSYGYIDGDSASLAELCCLISALTSTPIRQHIAVTGSINQYGEVQAIGGVNEKIEGFFRLCQARGLTGNHGVIIPAANRRNLVLKQEVIDAVKQELFAIYAVANVDQALEILTGKAVGTVDKDGNYPEDSINFKAISRLKEISDLAADEDKEEGG